jgi:putative ABC transport system ATP-binding protein
VIRLLVEVSRRQGAALVVTHDANVARWCDRTVQVRDGRLAGAQAETDAGAETEAGAEAKAGYRR